MEIAALVLGIIGLAGCFIPSLGWIGSLCGLLAIILGAIGVKNGGANKGKAKAGLILGILSFTLGIIFWLACAGCVVAGAAAGASMM